MMHQALMRQPSLVAGCCGPVAGQYRLPAIPVRRPLAVARPGTSLRGSSPPGDYAFGSGAAKAAWRSGPSGKLRVLCVSAHLPASVAALCLGTIACSMLKYIFDGWCRDRILP